MVVVIRAPYGAPFLLHSFRYLLLDSVRSSVQPRPVRQRNCLRCQIAHHRVRELALALSLSRLIIQAPALLWLTVGPHRITLIGQMFNSQFPIALNHVTSDSLLQKSETFINSPIPSDIHCPSPHVVQDRWSLLMSRISPFRA